MNRPAQDLPPVWRYIVDEEWEVLAGKTDAANDRLSLKIASARDWWFHVAGQPGSHVILRVPQGSEPGKDVLKQAASIAAWHSKARNGGVVPVSATLAVNVSKPRGAKPGTVTIRKEIKLKVRPGLPDQR